MISQVLFSLCTIVAIFSQIKLLFGSLVIELVWYVLKQLFTSVSVKVVDIHRAAKYFGSVNIHHFSPPLRSEVKVNSTWLITSELVNQRARKVLFTCVVRTGYRLPPFAGFSPPGSHAALFFLAGVCFASRRTKRKRDYP